MEKDVNKSLIQRFRGIMLPGLSKVKMEIEGERKEFDEPFCMIGKTEVRTDDKDVAERLRNLPNFKLFGDYIGNYEAIELDQPLKQVLITKDWDSRTNLLYRKNRVWVMSAGSVTDIIRTMNDNC